MTTPNDILDFWFSHAARANWFARSDAFDADIRTRFLAIYHDARAGKCAH